MLKFIYFKIVIFFLSIFSSCNSYAEISLKYSIEPLLSAENCYLNVKLTILNPSNNVTIIQLPDEWMVDYLPYIYDFETNNEYYEDEKYNFIKYIKHEKGEEFNVNYKVKTQNKEFTENSIYGNVTRSDLIQFPGHAVLAIPLGIKDHINVEIKFDNIPKAWKVFSQYGFSNPLKFTVNDPLDIKNASYSVGVKKLINLSENFYLSIYGNSVFNEFQIINDIARIIKDDKKFINHDYKSEEIYHIDILPHKNLNTIHGTSFKQGFVFSIGERINYEDFYKYLTHENLHYWIGSKYIPIEYCDPNAELCYWWSEGFVEYLSVLIPWINKKFDDDWALREINKILFNYYKSHARNRSNAYLGEHLNKDKNTNDLPYLRGFIAALYIDIMTRKISHDKCSIQNIIYDMINYSKINKKFSNNILFDIILIKYLPKSEIKKIREFILKGEDLSLEDLTEQISPVIINGNLGYQVSRLPF